MPQEVADGVPKIEGLSLVGDPKAMVVCFRGDAALNIYKVVSNCPKKLSVVAHLQCKRYIEASRGNHMSLEILRLPLCTPVTLYG